MSEHTRNPRIDPSVDCLGPPDESVRVAEAFGTEHPFENPAPTWDRFTITSFVGAGNMGSVYRAVDRGLNRAVALKFLRSDDPEQVRRFQREARSQAQIDHDHVCRIYEVGAVEGRPYIAMQFVEGRSLNVLAADLCLENKVRVMEQVARAAQAAHALGIVHRDIKPTNVMVEKVGNGGFHAYVLDFGVAREAGAPSLTMEGTVVGTPAYMAPEQIRGDQDLIDGRVDVYGIGATLFDVIAGEAPFSGSTRIETLTRVVTEEPQPLRQFDGRIPTDLETIVSTCLEKDPKRRYASARALSDDLRRFLDGEPIAGQRSALAAKIAKYLRRLVG